MTQGKVFIENRYSKIYFSIIDKRKNNIPDGYTETHHIIPKSLGGNNKKNNLVKLTAREHYICHLLLTKMVKYKSLKYKKMCVAFGMMSWMKAPNQKRDFKINSKIYEKLRKEHSKAMKYFQSKEKNSSYGKVWVYNEKMRECKKIAPEKIEKGWKIGRILNWEKFLNPDDKEYHMKRRYYIKNASEEIEERKCKFCNKKFNIGKYRRKSYCSKQCSMNYYNKKCEKDTLIKKGNETKYIRQIDLNSYKKCGWTKIKQP